MEITIRHLREQSALYRQKAARATDPIDADRYRGFAKLVDQQGVFFEKLTADREPTRPIRGIGSDPRWKRPSG